MKTNLHIRINFLIKRFLIKTCILKQFRLLDTAQFLKLTEPCANLQNDRSIFKLTAALVILQIGGFCKMTVTYILHAIFDSVLWTFENGPELDEVALLSFLGGIFFYLSVMCRPFFRYPADFWNQLSAQDIGCRTPYRKQG